MDRGRVDKSFAYGLINRMALLGGSLDFGGKSTEYFKIAAEAASRGFVCRGRTGESICPKRDDFGDDL